MNEHEIIEAFELLPEWEDRYEFIADLGRGLDTMPAVEQSERNRVQGCTTPTWVEGHLRAGDPPLMELVRGLVVVLLAPFQGKAPEDVLARDIGDYLGRLDLEEHLSPNRRQGMHAFIAKVKSIARTSTELP